LLYSITRIAAQSTTQKLAPALEAIKPLTKLQNVAIHRHQIKFTDKERAIGRLETIPIMMAGRLRKEGELIGRGGKRRGVPRVSRSMLKLRMRGIRGIGVNSIQRIKKEDKKEEVDTLGLQEGEKLSDKDFVEV
jgi:hypothetical protein